MMPIQNISGSWTGTIIYGDDYPEAGSELYFDMEISQNDQLIHGRSSDTGGVGASPDQAKFEGMFDGYAIRFIKQYCTSHFIEDGVVWIDESVPGPEIKYSGSYDPIMHSFTGEWRFEWEHPDSAEPLIYGTGTWHMHRK